MDHRHSRFAVLRHHGPQHKDAAPVTSPRRGADGAATVWRRRAAEAVGAATLLGPACLPARGPLACAQTQFLFDACLTHPGRGRENARRHLTISRKRHGPAPRWQGTGGAAPEEASSLRGGPPRSRKVAVMRATKHAGLLRVHSSGPEVVRLRAGEGPAFARNRSAPGGGPACPARRPACCQCPARRAIPPAPHISLRRSAP
jgi:hypothetical protein